MLSHEKFSPVEVMSGRFIFGLVSLLLFLPFVQIDILTGAFFSKNSISSSLSGVLGIYFYLLAFGKNSSSNGDAGGVVFSAVCRCH